MKHYNTQCTLLLSLFKSKRILFLENAPDPLLQAINNVEVEGRGLEEYWLLGFQYLLSPKALDKKTAS
jgi:hypothetical protein